MKPRIDINALRKPSKLDELRAEVERLKEQRTKLRMMLRVMLDCVDYTNGACSDMHVVGAVINDTTLARAQAAIEESRI